MNLGVKRLRLIMEALNDARRYAKLKDMRVGNICCNQDAPVTFADGSAVTERNVDAFIRERVRIHHGTWIVGQIEQAIRILEEGK